MIDGRTTDEIARDDSCNCDEGVAGRYRAMDPSLGRWTRQDPIGYPDGANRLEYLGSNPLTRLDPTGEDWWEWVPVVSTIGHTFSNPKGSDKFDYDLRGAIVTRQECADDPIGAEKRCKDALRKEFLGFLGDWLGVPIAADATKAVAGIVAGGVAKWALKNGARGAIGAAVTGGVLLGDAALDGIAISKKAFNIGDGYEAAKDLVCNCDRYACGDKSDTDSLPVT